MQSWNEKFPGLYAPEGEEVDVQKYIENWFLDHPEGKPTDPVDEFMEKDWCYKDDYVPFWMKRYEGEFEPTEELSGENNIGVELPKYLKEHQGTGVAAN